MQILTPVGIDVASQKFDVAVWKGKAAYKSKAFSNTPKGFDALKKWLEPFGDCHICMEATGAYSEPLSTFLADAGYAVSVENPARIKSFGCSELSRNKTDKGDDSSKAVVAWAGLNPMLQESGLWKGKSQISKVGNAMIRKALYMPALTAMRYNPAIIALKERMNARNKSGKVVVCAAMKKLLQQAYGVLKSGQVFDAGICLAR
ncbi:IS110 family transposase [Sodalis glossinidius]|uniref:IS110 family transposase n=1 Tax=Sodalis glossinidius TaxID=63612 RepID=UPI0014123D29|nr:transposase [Sodalis glossinidius]